MTKPSIPRLKDVAAEAQVSLSAASRILRGDTSRFGAETKDRVEAAAKKLGWRQNLLISGMQTGKTKTVGVLIPPFDSFWINVLSGLHSRLSEADYLPITVWLGDLTQQPYFEAADEAGIRQINRLLDRRVDALIMWPQIAIAYRKCFAEIAKRDVPVVVIDSHTKDPLGDVVLTTEEASTYSAAQHLIDLGHRRLGCLCERDDAPHSWSRVRFGHFEKGVKKTKGVSICSAQLNKAGSNGVAVATKLLKHKNRPTAIFAVNDHLARNVYQAASKLGLRIPEDISVVGFSDLDFASELEPPLTTIHQRPAEMGSKAADLVLARLDEATGSKKGFDAVEVAGDLIVRASTAPPSA